MSPSKGMYMLSLGFLAGVVISYFFFSWAAFALFLFAGTLFLLVSAIRPRPRALFAALLVLALTLGYVRLPYAAGVTPEAPPVFTKTQAFLAERAGEVAGGPAQAMFAAMTLGHRAALSQETKEILNRTGTRHIVAISGLHMAIVVLILFKVLVFAGLWRRQAFFASLVGLFGYVLLVGAPPSAVRAGIMAGMLLAAYQSGRLTQAWRLLLAAAVLMVLLHPAVLFTVSFQLSFAAVLGIILFKPWVDRWLVWVPLSLVRDLVSVSLAAQLATLPLVAYTFSRVSLVGVLANVVAVPLLPLVMALGIGFVIAGWWHPLLARLFVWPAWVVLNLIHAGLEALSRLPFASLTAGAFGMLAVAGYYLVLVIIYRRYARHYVHDSSL